jgi:hypothetical protein
MNQIACVFACLAVVAGCQRSRDPAATAVPAAYRADIENLCDAMVRSGATQRPADEHTLVVATWLGSNLQTEEAHQYLVQIQPLTGDAKAAALEAEAQRVGLARCALADVWRGTR